MNILNLFKKKPIPILPPFPSEAVTWSGHPFSGWVSGVVIPSAKGNKFITARHLYSPIGANVYIKLDDGSTFTTKVVSKTTPDIRVFKSVKLAPKPELDRYWYGDIAICETADPFPITPPEIGYIKSGTIYAQHQDGSVASHQVGTSILWGRLYDTANWMRTFWGKAKFKAGDSGFPWFAINAKTNKWELVGITSRVATDSVSTPWSAEAPRLGASVFKDEISKLVY